MTTPAETQPRLDEVVLLDVREDDEWAAGHVEGALHVPLGQLQARVDELPKDAELVCVCRSGARSGRATAALANAGFDVTNLEGGMQAWAAAGYDLVDSDGDPGQVI